MTSTAPYLFEPTCNPKHKSKRRKCDSPIPEEPWDPATDDCSWCICQKCSPKRLPVERVCCGNLHTVQDIFKPGFLCVTDNNDFNAVCLSEPVLRFNYFMQRFNETPKVYKMNAPISNKSYRYCSYRTFTFWSQGRLGRFNRRVIPACVVQTVREQYPDENGIYTGYREANELDEIEEFI